MTETELEIREALMGNTIPMEKGHLRTMGPDDYRLPIGVADGANAVRFLGVRQNSKVLLTELKPAELDRAVRKSMHKVGRSLLLLGQPDIPACLIRYVLTRPAIITVRYIDDVPVVTSWAARGATGWISNLRALASFKKQLPDSISFADDAEAPKEEKITRRQFRKQVREAKKSMREERRAVQQAEKEYRKSLKENEEGGDA